MLKNEVDQINLSELKQELVEKIREISEITGIEIKEIDENPVNISSQLIYIQKKLKVITLIKTLLEGTLLGIKA